MKLIDLVEYKKETIRSASHGDSGINCDQSEYITDPKGYFRKIRNWSKIK